MDYLNSQIEKYVMERTKLGQEVLDGIREKKRDTYFNSNESIELGIADEL